MLRFVGNCDWGLALRDIYFGEDVEGLLIQKQEIEKRGYEFFQRLYVDAAHGLDYESPIFWRGVPHEGEAPTIRWMMDMCKSLDILILPVVTTFHPGYPPQYNEVRHEVPQSNIHSLWSEIISEYWPYLAACQIDNEPLSGGGGYSPQEYWRRVRQEAPYLISKYVTPIASHYNANKVWSDVHLPIGGPEHDFPKIPDVESASECWLRPGVPSSQYVELVKWAKQHPKITLLGMNFGSEKVPGNGYRWGNSMIRSFLCDSVGKGWNEMGIAVLDELGEMEGDLVMTQKQLDEYRNGLSAELARIQSRIDIGDGNTVRLRGRRAQIISDMDRLNDVLGY